MKNSKVLMIRASIFLLSVSATIAYASEPRPTSPLHVYGCPVSTHAPNPGDVCVKEYTVGGQADLISPANYTHDNPFKATVTASLIAGNQNPQTHNQDTIAHLQVNNVTDKNDVYDADGSLSFMVAARKCSYLGGTCTWSQVNTDLVMTRVADQRYFVDSASFDIILSEQSGDDGDTYLTEVDLWFKDQTSPLVVKF